jgi:serine/threonine-protein kinase
VRGKLRYMPPEQLGCRRVDRRADVFAVGVMLWEAMVGQRLWKGRFNEEIRRRVLSGDIPPPSRVRRDVPRELEAICLRALSHDPEARPATAADLGREIERFLSELGPPVASRQLGRTVSLLFQNLLRQHRLELDSQLIGLSLRGAERGEALFTETGTGVGSPDGAGLARRWDARRAAVVGLGGLALGALLLALGVGFRRVEHTRLAASAPAVLPSALAPGGRPPRRTVRVQVRANPAESRLYFDHTLLPNNPALSTMLADGQPHLVRAEADGYGAAELRFVLDTDLDLSLTLDPDHSPRPRLTSLAPSSSHRPPSARPDDHRCQPPFVVDARGVKVFLPECL